MATTTIPDDTIYLPGENIICRPKAETGYITVTLSAGVGLGLVSAGGSVTFSLDKPNLEDDSE
ncbi:hypothetical protein LTR95_007739 [Oleoguttula sp. CCFEE 5521]